MYTIVQLLCDLVWTIELLHAVRTEWTSKPSTMIHVARYQYTLLVRCLFSIILLHNMFTCREILSLGVRDCNMLKSLLRKVFLLK